MNKVDTTPYVLGTFQENTAAFAIQIIQSVSPDEPTPQPSDQPSIAPTDDTNSPTAQPTDEPTLHIRTRIVPDLWYKWAADRLPAGGG